MAKVIIGSQEESYWRLTRPPVRKLRSCSKHIICILCKVFCELYMYLLPAYKYLLSLSAWELS